MANHFSILAWEIPWIKEFGGLQSPRGGHKEADTTERLSTHTHHTLCVVVGSRGQSRCVPLALNMPANLETQQWSQDWKRSVFIPIQMVGWNHRLDRHEFDQALGVGDGQEGLACCSLWGCKESDMTERLN